MDIAAIARGNPVLTAEALADALAATASGEPDREPPLVVLDVRWHLRPPPKGRRRRADPPGLEDFDAGHVPGAVFVDLDTELA